MTTSLQHRALMITSSRSIKLAWVPTESPGPADIVVAPLFVGLCGTDLQILNGRRPDSALILGHEGVAEIIEVGDLADEFEVGQYVVFNPVNPYNQDEILGHSTNGLFQKRFLVSRRSINSGLVIPFDQEIPLICGALVEPLGSVIYGESLVRRVTNPTCIAVVGAGPIGLLFALYAREQGCQYVFLIHNAIERLEWAIRANIIRPEEALLDTPNLDKIILEKTNGHGVNAAYLCTTKAAALKALGKALRYVENGGCIDLVGGFSDGDMLMEIGRLDLNTIRRSNVCGLPVEGFVKHVNIFGGKSIALTGHRGTSHDHLQSAMRILRDMPQKFAHVITHTVSLNAAASIITKLAHRKLRTINGKECVKVVLDLSVQESNAPVREFNSCTI